MADWPASLRRKAQSGWESIKKFSVAAGKEAVLGVFQETAVGAPLSLGVDAVAVVDEDLHS